MTTAELRKILDDENHKLTADELKEVVYQLKQDTFQKYGEALEVENLHISQYYLGGAKAFEICLDLLEHLKGDHDAGYRKSIESNEIEEVYLFNRRNKLN